MMPKAYTDPRARQVHAIALLVGKGSEPTGDLIEACRDLNAEMARWARRNKYEAVTDGGKDIA